MPPDNLTPNENIAETKIYNKVTPFSKYLAMALFVLLPFIGGYVGYKYSPKKIVTVEKVVEVERIVEVEVAQDSDAVNPEVQTSEVSTYTNSEYGFSFDYPSKYGNLNTDFFSGNRADNQSLFRMKSEDGDTFVAILYGSDYDSGTDTVKSPICTNEKYKSLHDKCIERINSLGTEYFEINLDMVYGPEKRNEFFVNEDFSLIVSNEWNGNEELNNMILNSFKLTNTD